MQNTVPKIRCSASTGPMRNPSDSLCQNIFRDKGQSDFWSSWNPSREQIHPSLILQLNRKVTIPAVRYIIFPEAVNQRTHRISLGEAGQITYRVEL